MVGTMEVVQIELFKPFGLQLDPHMVVQSTEPAAQELGVRKGMKLLRFNGSEIVTSDTLRLKLAKHPTGVKAVLEFSAPLDRSSSPFKARTPTSPMLRPMSSSPYSAASDSPRLAAQMHELSPGSNGWELTDPVGAAGSQGRATGMANRSRNSSSFSLDGELGDNSVVVLAGLLEKTEVALRLSQEECAQLRELLQQAQEDADREAHEREELRAQVLEGQAYRDEAIELRERLEYAMQDADRLRSKLADAPEDRDLNSCTASGGLVVARPLAQAPPCEPQPSMGLELPVPQAMPSEGSGPTVSESPTTPPPLPVLKRGHLMKRRNLVVWGWRERYFELLTDGTLVWWTEPSKRDGVRGSIAMQQVREIGVYKNNPQRFDVHYSSESIGTKTLQLMCQDGNAEWVEALRRWQLSSHLIEHSE